MVLSSNLASVTVDAKMRVRLAESRSPCRAILPTYTDPFFESCDCRHAVASSSNSFDL